MTSGTGHGSLGHEAVWPRRVGMGGGAVSLPREPRRASRSLSLLREDRLTARASRGDRAAFAELYRHHHQRLFRYCLAILHDAEDAADALQTTMAKALAALEGGEAVRGVRPWLFRIAHNASIDTLRARRPQIDLDDLAETESSTLTAPSAASEAEDRAELVQAVADIRDLPHRQAGALVMRELSGLAYAEIAAAFDTSAGNARQLVHGARSALHAARRGRDMDCEVVRLVLGEADGKTPRDRRVRAHLANCEDCRAFQRSIRTRRSALAAVVPPLAPWAAGDILGRLVERGSRSGAGLAAGGGSAVGGLAKIAGAPAAAKLAAGAAAVGTAVLAGGFMAADAGLLGDGDRSSRAAPGFLTPGAPKLAPMPKAAPAPERGQGRRRPASEPSPAVPAPPTPPVDPAALAQRGPVSRVEPTIPEGGGDSATAVTDEPRLELGTVRLPDPPTPNASGHGLPDIAGNADLPVGQDLTVHPDISVDPPDLRTGRGDLPDGGGRDVPAVDPPDVPAVDSPDVPAVDPPQSPRVNGTEDPAAGASAGNFGGADSAGGSSVSQAVSGS